MCAKSVFILPSYPVALEEVFTIKKNNYVTSNKRAKIAQQVD